MTAERRAQLFASPSRSRSREMQQRSDGWNEQKDARQRSRSPDNNQPHWARGDPSGAPSGIPAGAPAIPASLSGVPEGWPQPAGNFGWSEGVCAVGGSHDPATSSSDPSGVPVGLPPFMNPGQGCSGPSRWQDTEGDWRSPPDASQWAPPFSDGGVEETQRPWDVPPVQTDGPWFPPPVGPQCLAGGGMPPEDGQWQPGWGVIGGDPIGHAQVDGWQPASPDLQQSGASPPQVPMPSTAPW